MGVLEYATTTLWSLRSSVLEIAVDPGEAEKYMVKLANREISEGDVAAWLRAQMPENGRLGE